MVGIAFHAGYPQTAYQGSTALVALVQDNKIYIANSGHSKAVILREADPESANLSNMALVQS